MTSRHAWTESIMGTGLDELPDEFIYSIGTLETSVINSRNILACERRKVTSRVSGLRNIYSVTWCYVS